MANKLPCCRRTEPIDLDKNSGARISTYVIFGQRGTRCCVLNGAAARTGQPGDQIIICYSAYYDLEAESADLRREQRPIHLFARSLHSKRFEIGRRSHPRLCGSDDQTRRVYGGRARWRSCHLNLTRSTGRMFASGTTATSLSAKFSAWRAQIRIKTDKWAYIYQYCRCRHYTLAM